MLPIEIIPLADSVSEASQVAVLELDCRELLYRGTACSHTSQQSIRVPVTYVHLKRIKIKLSLQDGRADSSTVSTTWSGPIIREPDFQIVCLS